MKLNKKSIAAAFVASLVAGGAQAAVEVELSNVFACPVFLSTTQVSGTPVQFEFMTSWSVVAPGVSWFEERGPDCCMHVYQQGFIPPPVPTSVLSLHYLDPQPATDIDLINTLSAECPQYIGSGDIYTSLCNDDILTSGYCAGARPAPAEEKIDPRALRLRDLNTATGVAKAQDAGEPLLVEDAGVADRDSFLSWVRSWKPASVDVKPLTTAARVLEENDCRRIEQASAVEGEARSAAAVYDCKQGAVLVHEFKRPGISKIQAPAGGKAFEVREGVSGGAQYLAGADGRRQSTISTWDQGVILQMTLLHGDSDQSAWLKSVAGKAVPVR